MTQYNSRDQITFNCDPEPVVRPSDGMRGSIFLRANLLPGERGPLGKTERLVFDPRAEYTPTPNNPTSRVLSQFRQLHGSKRGVPLADAAIAWRGNLGSAVLNGIYSADEAAHAARVLSRIAERHLVAA